MGTATYVFRADDYPRPRFPVWDAEHWLDKVVEFTICGHTFCGIVESAERLHLANGIHDILEVEVLGEKCQVKVLAHRQKFRKVEDA